MGLSRIAVAAHSRRARLPHVVHAAAANVSVQCPQGTHKYLLESVGKGYYEVIGTLHDGGSIVQMTPPVFMGDNFGTRRLLTSAHVLAIVQAPLTQRAACAPGRGAQTRTCTSRWSS